MFNDDVNHTDKIETIDADLPPLGIPLDSPAFNEEEYQNSVNVLRNRLRSETNLQVRDGKIYINTCPVANYTNNDIPTWKLVIPKSLVPDLLLQAHNSPTGAHAGISKTLDIIKRYYYWPRMQQDIKEHINNCLTCKMSKASNTRLRPLMGNYEEFNRAWQKIYIDFLGPYPRSKSGNTMIIIILDHFTKFVYLKAIKHATSVSLIDCLRKDIFTVFGVPEVVHSDNGRQFESNAFAEFLNKYGVRHVFTPKYSPQSNASERVNRTILAAIRSYVRDRHQDWDCQLDHIAGALRNVTHESTGFSPYFLVFGQHMISHASSYQVIRELQACHPSDIMLDSAEERVKEIRERVLEHLKKAHARHEKAYNRTAKFREFSVNQTVFVRNYVKSCAPDKFSEKLAPKFVKGIVKRRIGKVAYEIMDVDGKVLGIYHGKDIKD